MKKFFLVLLSGMVSYMTYAQTNFWSIITEPEIASPKERKIVPTSGYKVYQIQQPEVFENWLAKLPEDPARAFSMSLPVPDGSTRIFKVWQTPIMEPALAAKYPHIKTFTGYAADNRFVTVKFDYTTKGFHAMVFAGKETYAIDPYTTANDGNYIVYYKEGYTRPDGHSMICELAASDDHELQKHSLNLSSDGVPSMQWKVNGQLKKTYRMALACTGEYAVAVAGANPTKADVLSAMVTTMNRVNGIYEREVAVSMVLIANNDELIFLSGSTDPYTNNSGSAMLGQNQTTVNDIIGNANYDIGHVFSTGGGGIAQLGSVCRTNSKARGVTGSANPVGDFFDVDYVAHEIGHQFGAQHTFNTNTGGCSGNGVANTAFEPGSGSTIMAYAGLCGSGNNLQNHSDAFFHTISLDEISNYITTQSGASCPVTTPVSNTPPVVPSFNATYYIPTSTPFEITAPEVTDADHDSLWYSWVQWDLGNFGSPWANPNNNGPIFRAFFPDESRTRVFPVINRLVANITSYVGEKLPEDTRDLNFKLAVRDMKDGLGIFNIPTDVVKLKVIATPDPFEVTYPNTGGSLNGGSSQTITWNVAGTDLAPINCDKVDIFMSEDGGFTYPHTIALGVPNTGSYNGIIPNINTTKARVKVKASNSVFFDISNSNFTIIYDPTSVREPEWLRQLVVYPVPATNFLHIENNLASNLNLSLYTTTGQLIWEGDVVQRTQIPVSSLSSGLYFLKVRDIQKGETAIKRVAIN